jgi:hypothetical protein
MAEGSRMTIIHEERLDDEIDRLVTRYGLGDVLAALCRIMNDRGYASGFKALNKVYEKHFWGKSR